MKKQHVLIAAALAAGVCGMLRAEGPVAPSFTGQSMQEDRMRDSTEYNEFVQQNAALAKDADSTGVEAVIYAAAALRSKTPEEQIQFFNGVLQETKSRPVQREIRFALYEMYRAQGQVDKELDQLHQLIIDQ